MRRWCAALLLGVYGLLLGTPLLAIGRGLESRLPACCRRAGAHHCAMAMTPHVEDGRPQWTAPAEQCPMYPAVVPGVRGVGFNAVVGGQVRFAMAMCHPTSVVQASSRRRIARERSRHKRGPPSAPGIPA